MARTGNDTWNVASNVEPTTPEADRAPAPRPRPAHPQTHLGAEKWTMMGTLKKVWLPLVIVFALVVAVVLRRPPARAVRTD